ncbi:MAG: diol dehydratase reactivase ATPase-like domain-containing protein, partial [Kineosporiaceae bacterium]
GHAVGRPVPVEADPRGFAGNGEPVVLVAADPLGFRRTAAQVERWLQAGCAVGAIVLAGDEARLVAARSPVALPIVDGVDAAAVLTCTRVAVEVAAPGAFVRMIADPIRLVHDLGLGPDEHDHAAAAAQGVGGVAAAVIGLLPTGAAPTPERGAAPSVRFADGTVLALDQAGPALAGRPVGQVAALLLPPAALQATRDIWLVDLDAAPAVVDLRAGAVHRRHLSVSALGETGAAAVWPETLVAGGRRRVEVIGTEVGAARAGALSTPGARPGALVIDLGGGTLDLAAASGDTVTAAGSGELLTASVAHVLGISTGAAEWVKRGPAVRVDAPSQVSDETGTRHFRDRPAPPGVVGWLTAPGPGGELPFSTTVTVSQWRSLRLGLKRAVFADNLRRAAASLSTAPASGSLERQDCLLVGGPAGDDEVIQILSGVVPGAVLGRADVASRLGHRWAVAYGLLLLPR